jgi:ATP-dependent Clp protease ATP-binding subunit ClpC
VLERFTDAAREAVARAHAEASELGHPFIGPEHLLLGTVRSRAPVVAGLGLDHERVRELVIAVLGGGIGRSHQLPFTPAAQAVLDRALVVELEMGDHRIGPEHLLHALAQQPEAMAILEAADCPPHVVLSALGHK